MTEIKEFMSKFFEKYGLLDSCISSYNLICETLINIIQKFDLKFSISNEQTEEDILVHLELYDPKIILPGEDLSLPKTSIEAITKRKDFMCRY